MAYALVLWHAAGAVATTDAAPDARLAPLAVLCGTLLLSAFGLASDGGLTVMGTCASGRDMAGGFVLLLLVVVCGEL